VPWRLFINGVNKILLSYCGKNIVSKRHKSSDLLLVHSELLFIPINRHLMELLLARRLKIIDRRGILVNGGH
jgi:hypothetical protein